MLSVQQSNMEPFWFTVRWKTAERNHIFLIWQFDLIQLTIFKSLISRAGSVPELRATAFKQPNKSSSHWALNPPLYWTFLSPEDLNSAQTHISIKMWNSRENLNEGGFRECWPEPTESRTENVSFYLPDIPQSTCLKPIRWQTQRLREDKTPPKQGNQEWMF